MSRLLALASLLGLTAPLYSAALPKVPPGFSVELLLEAPAIEAPTALCVAANGDVYFAEDPMDMSGPPTENLDRIWLLEGGDPKKKVLFADKMWAVMGMEVVGDKLYVVHAPHVTVFTLDARGRARDRQELFDDLGPKVAGLPSFNDHIPSGIRMGMDGYLYVSIGDKGIPKMTRKETDRGSVHVAEGRWRRTKEGHHISLEGGGVIRFRPDGSGLEVFAGGTRNHLDVPLDEHDRIFVRDNTDDGLGWWTRLMYLPQGGYLGYPWAYTRRPGETLPMVRDFGGGSPCGGWVYLDDGLPETYRGRVFHCEWGQGKVWAVKLAPDGAGFKFVDQLAFMEPDAVKDFRPFSLRPTADGRGFYVTDWAFSGWLSKAKAGRLWKVTYTGDDARPAPRGKDTDSVEKLIRSLDHPAHTERLRAQRALIARGKAAHEAARDALRDKELSKTARIHLLWVLRETADRKSLAEWWLQPAYDALADKDADVRLEAVRVIGSYRAAEHPHGLGKIPPPRDYLVERVKEDGDAGVRRQAASALGSQIIFSHEVRELLRHLGREQDHGVRRAVIRALKDSVRAEQSTGAPLWSWRSLDEALAREDFLAGMPRAVDGLIETLTEEYDLHAVAVLKRLASKGDAPVRRRAVEALARVYKDRKPYAGGWWGTQPAAQKPPAREVAWEGTPAVREALLRTLADRDAEVRKAAVAGLQSARDPETLGPLVEQFGREKSLETRTDIVRAIAGLETPRAAEFLAGLLRDLGNAEALRLGAIAGLEKVKGPASEKALAEAAGEGPVAVRVRAVAALGALATPACRPAAEGALKSPEPEVRRAAAGALAKIGVRASAAALSPLLTDRETSVRIAAIQALGALKARAAVPALVRAAGDEPTAFDAISALAQVPDRRALTAYLAGLSSKNADLRKACRLAIVAVGDEVVPTLEELAKRNEIPAAALAELREVYSSFVPVLSWRLIGPFPRDGKAHPPEQEQKFDAAYKGADDKEVKWQTVRADAKEHGRVNLAARLSPNQQVEAYAYAEIDSAAARDATLLAGSDDTITVWLNGKKVHDHQGDRGWSHDQDRVNVRLEKGTNRLLVKCGNSGGPWDFSVAVSGEVDRYAFLKGVGRKYDLEAFRAFARKTPGDAERGRKLFNDQKGLACVKCHAVAGTGGQVGPDLAGIALRYKREDLMTSILEPSKVIAQGYETIVVETRKGQVLTGVFKGENADAVNLTDVEGKQHRVLKKDIEDRAFSQVSTMPNGLSDGMTLQDFADLIAFLESRREEKK